MNSTYIGFLRPGIGAYGDPGIDSIELTLSLVVSMTSANSPMLLNTLEPYRDSGAFFMISSSFLLVSFNYRS
ncbi:hypothetical protein [Fructobacillus sp. EFB-N1]|uniref:hypothetical protein n=1 Tax=Fructobacillus sp. EFB-N1 TaxID=1658766 RepID=UPI0013791432|nr:hypothetical protein [Fructobacillus sp. EFB-N1]